MNVVERQERALSESDDDDFLGQRQHGAVRTAATLARDLRWRRLSMLRSSASLRTRSASPSPRPGCREVFRPDQPQPTSLEGSGGDAGIGNGLPLRGLGHDPGNAGGSVSISGETRWKSRMTLLHLEGWAAHRQGTSWDHTYIKSRQPLRQWECFNSLSGGRCICKAAIQINDPPLKNFMRYAVDGLCFQAANRILFQTGQSVRKAIGYALSLLIFGVYGRGRWVRSVSIDDNADDLELNRVLDMKNIFLSGDEAGDLSDIRLDIRRSISALALALDRSDISKARYLENLAILSRLTVLRCTAFLGKDRAGRFFGEASNDPFNIIDSQAM